ncbi:MAG TPA: hypothetical protein VMP11_03180 [Verrucomicrobiae bacterium]|nr:hypothetical protein [Verrucomicrobiae bacterium]
MSDFNDRAKRYHQAIHDILIKEWDPIGVGDEPRAQDEYDSYVPGVYKHLIHRSPERDLFDYLQHIETKRMCLHANRAHTEKIVKRLMSLVEEIEGGKSSSTSN